VDDGFSLNVYEFKIEEDIKYYQIILPKMLKEFLEKEKNRLFKRKRQPD
jgi:SNF2 family DNA or RNA helicase